MEPKVSCIIPAYNEAKTISGVIKTCLKTPEIDQIIVVNDGSKDKTKERAERFKSKGVEIINLPKNRGKGYAVSQGVKASKNKVLLFLDADLTHIKPYHLSSLIKPVLQNNVDMTIGPEISTKKPYWFINIITFCGQRCLLKKYLLDHLEEIEDSKYGIEVILNEIFAKKRVVVIPILTHKKLHLIKPKKQKDWLASYTREVWQVTKKIIKTKSRLYQIKVKKQLTMDLAEYFKTSTDKIKKYLEQETV